ASQPGHNAQHPAKPVLRLHLQHARGADRGRRPLSGARPSAQPDDRQRRHEHELGAGRHQRAPPARRQSVIPRVVRAALYIGLATIGHFIWEAAQLPLCTLWSTGAPREIAVALFHCTGGDVLITTATVTAAAALARHLRWPAFGWRMALTAIVLGAA